MKEKDVEIFKKIQAQLQSVYQEISALSKKTPNDGVNKFKLKFINQILVNLNSFLDKKYSPFSDFTVFSEDDLPTNADVVFILSQYLSCMEKMRADNIDQDMGSWYWSINGKITNIRTARPQKLERN